MSKRRMKRCMCGQLFDHPLLCLVPPGGLTVRPWLCKPLTSVLVCVGPFLHGLHPLPSPAPFVCLLHFPFYELYLTPPSVLYLPPAMRLDPHGVREAEGKGVVVSRNCAHFLKTFFLPRTKMVSLTSITFWSGLSACVSGQAISSFI